MLMSVVVVFAVALDELGGKGVKIIVREKIHTSRDKKTVSAHLLELGVGDAGGHADLEHLARLQNTQALQLLHHVPGDRYLRDEKNKRVSHQSRRVHLSVLYD